MGNAHKVTGGGGSRGKLSLSDGQLSLLMLMPNNIADADGFAVVVVVAAVVVAAAAADAIDTGAGCYADGWDEKGSCHSKC